MSSPYAREFFSIFSFLFPSLQYCKYSSKVQICFIMVTFSMLPLRANNILAFCIPHSTNSIRYFEQRTIQEKGPRQQYYNKNINQKYSIQKHSFFFPPFLFKMSIYGETYICIKELLKDYSWEYEENCYHRYFFVSPLKFLSDDIKIFPEVKHRGGEFFHV